MAKTPLDYGIERFAREVNELLQLDATLIAKAREQYATNNIEIDTNAEISHADHGAWVQAWVWVGKEDQ